MTIGKRSLKGAAIAALTTLVGVAAVQADAPAGLPGAGIRPDATMLQFPDVSATQIVFVYGNDLYVVDRAGGTAVQLASPDGKESFPKFNDDGSIIAFTGNYEGDQDIYVIPSGGGGMAHRVTHHPANEVISGWTPSGEIIFYQNGLAGLGRQQQIFTVAPTGGLPNKLPVPYGTNGAISPDGTTLAYTPWSRDTRTWKRYRGGMASDIWLLDLNTFESQKITDWEGTDTLPMWHDDTVYYVSDAGPAHRWNIWSYDTSNGNRKQVTTFTDYDVKWPSIGPGSRGRGEIIFQNGSRIYLLNLRSGKSSAVDIVIPGDRPDLRPQTIDYSEDISSSAVSGGGKRVAVEARGDIWSLPANEGVTRRITATSGIAERDPAFSPDGKWLAYFSDATGEYELYMEPSNGKGEAVQLTSDGGPFKSMDSWSPDSKIIAFTDKTGSLFLHTLGGDDSDEPGTTKLIVQDPWAGSPTVSWSHDSNWMAMILADAGNQNGTVNLYNIADATMHTVTDAMFNAGAVTFDREGDWLYFSSDRNYSPTYSSIDSTWIYKDSSVILAVPLREDVENHLLATSDEIEIDEGDDDADDDADGEDGEDDEETSIAGKWEGIYITTEPEGIPEQSFTLHLLVDDDGVVTGTIGAAGETLEIFDVTYDKASGVLGFKMQADSEYSIDCTIDGGNLEGTWSSAAGLSGTLTMSLAEDDDEEESDDEDKEPLEIDLDGFESRAIRIDTVDPTTIAGMFVNNKGELLYATITRGRGGRGQGATLHIVNFLAEDEDDRDSKKVIDGVQDASMTADGKSILVTTKAGIGVVKAAAGQSLKDKVPTDAMKGKVNPREEWVQILTEAWRLERDFFYDPNMHGLDWNAVLARYLPLVDDCVVRDDVSFLIRELISELNVGHAYYRAQNIDQGPSENVGMLGCDYELATTNEGTAYRISKIYEGAAWDDDARGPLSQPGVDVNEGDFLLAVNGMEIDTNDDPWAAFVGTAGQTVALTVSTKPVIDDDAREVLIKPIEGENGLRYRAWVERNRKYVEYKSGGTVGYIYVPNTGIQGQNELVRQFYGQKHKGGLIIDDRWNGGGQIPDRFIELLNRPRTNYWALRDGKDWAWPPDSHQGPKAMLINGLAGSGGDMFPSLFKQAGLGKLIGMRTWGGLVGISGNPQLIDGTAVTVPTFGYYETDGTWGIEGHGVDPDILVVDDPALMVEAPGGDFHTLADPQLDVAINTILAEIEQNPYSPPMRPANADRSGMGIRPEDK